MNDINKEEEITKSINNITQKISGVLLDEFMKLSKDLQLSIILIKSSQLLLANVLCHVAATKDELDKITSLQGAEMTELTHTCAHIGFSDKFEHNKH